MDARIKVLRSLAPRNAGLASYQAVLEAAAGLFQQFPADAITLRDILTLSGVSNQTLYNYFPAGRDDVALVLSDRLGEGVLATFKAQNLTVAWETHSEPADITRALSASLARAAFAPLKENLTLQASVFAYLKFHRLDGSRDQALQLEEAFRQEILLRYGSRIQRRAVPRVAQLCVHLALHLKELALAQPGLPLDDLESSARKVMRTLLSAALSGADPASDFHEVVPDAAALTPIASATITAATRESILSRLLKRKQRKAGA